MDYTIVLPRAIEIAARAYNGKVDKGGQIYLMHLIRVMNAVHSPIEKVVAISHDYIEDGMGSKDSLFRELGIEGKLFTFDYDKDHISNALSLLTRNKDEKYFDYINRIAKGSLYGRGATIAKNVKIADLKDNLDEERLKLLEEDVADFLRSRYTKALKILIPPCNEPDDLI